MDKDTVVNIYELLMESGDALQASASKIYDYISDSSIHHVSIEAIDDLSDIAILLVDIEDNIRSVRAAIDELLP